MKKIFNFIKENHFTIFMMLIMIVLCYLFPYSGDDFAWGTKIGLERLNIWFDNYNGRYSGNLLILLLTRSKLLRIAIESVTIFLIIRYMNLLSTKDKKDNKLLIVLMLLLMPVTIFRQTIAWASGFANYLIPILLILFFINSNKDLFIGKSNKKNEKKLVILFYFFASFMGSMFIENITIYNFLLALTVVIFEKIKIKKISKSNIYYLIGAILGSIMMFTNSSYLSILNNKDGYRTIAQENIIIRSIKTYLSELSGFIFNDNWLICSLICLLAIIVGIKFLTNNKKVNKNMKFAVNASVVGATMFILNFLYINLKSNNLLFMKNLFNEIYYATLGLIMVLSLLIITIFCIKNNETRNRIIFYITSLIIINVPLLIITPIGSRLFLTTYVFFILISLELINYIFKENKFNYTIVCKTAITVLLIYFVMIYADIYKIENVQKKYINENKNSNKETLYLPLLPHTQYLHCVNRTDEVFGYRYKLFYGIDTETKLVYQPYKEWLRNKDK